MVKLNALLNVFIK